MTSSNTRNLSLNQAAAADKGTLNYKVPYCPESVPLSPGICPFITRNLSLYYPESVPLLSPDRLRAKASRGRKSFLKAF